MAEASGSSQSGAKSKALEKDRSGGTEQKEETKRNIVSAEQSKWSKATTGSGKGKAQQALHHNYNILQLF